MRVMVRTSAIALVFVLIFSSVALATPGRSSSHRTGDQSVGRSHNSGKTSLTGRASGAGAYSAAAKLKGRSLETSQTPSGGKGRSKFQLEGTINFVGPDFLSVQIKTGTNSIKGLRGQESVLEVTGSPKITLKGKVVTIEQILVGDRVHIGGTLDTSGDAPRLIASRIIIRPRRSAGGGSIEDSSTPDGSGDTSSSVDSSATTALGTTSDSHQGGVTLGAKVKAAATSIVSWFLSLL